MPTAGLIFDMDDTLVATAAIWRQAERQLLASVNHPWTETLSAKYKGMNALDVAATVHHELALDVDLPAFQQRMRTMLIESFAQAAPSAMPGAVALVRRLTGVAPMAVASGSPQPVIDAMMARLDLADAFAATISSESVSRGKPHPDVFLAAAERLGVAPDGCLVFEDSVVGALAAKAAGMRCFVVPSLASADFGATSARLFPGWPHVQRADVASALTSARRT